MNKYHKIPNVWKRDPETKYKTLIEGNFSTETLFYLASCHAPFWAHEKIDGTNVRITYAGGHVAYNGRNDLTDAEGNYMPPNFSKNLWEHLRYQYTANWFDAWFDPTPIITLYGEGFGAGIQKGGAYGDAQFCMFDIMINGLWMPQNFVTDIANRSGVIRAPMVALGTLEAHVARTRAGFNSSWGSFPAEGIVCRPLVELSDRYGQRVICKIKIKDFPNG